MSHPVKTRAPIQGVEPGAQAGHKVKPAYCSHYVSGKGEQVQETSEARRCLESVSGWRTKRCCFCFVILSFYKRLPFAFRPIVASSWFCM